jgi:sec-independent protein translocase protein TatA
LIILVAVLLIFGPKRLPEMGKSLGKGLRQFKESVSGIQDLTNPTTSTPVETTPGGPQSDSPIEASTPTTDSEHTRKSTFDG